MAKDVLKPARTRGRPAKNGVKDPRALARALAVLYAFNNARARGEKYSVAIRESVAFCRQVHPGEPISETEVKRILAEFRPKNAPTALVAEFSVVEGEEAKRIRRKLSFRGFLSEDQAESTPEGDSKPLKRFTIRLADTPKYPRHNAKDPESSPPER